MENLFSAEETASTAEGTATKGRYKKAVWQDKTKRLFTEANQNFSKVARVVDEHGTAVILKNNVPRYLVIDFSKAEQEKVASTEDVLAISERLIKQNKEAYEVLAK